MIVDRHAQNALGVFLPDDIFIQPSHDLARRRQRLQHKRRRCLLALIARRFLVEDTLTQFDAVVTDEYTVGTRDQPFDFIVAASAK